jgi:hypothetical protein
VEEQKVERDFELDGSTISVLTPISQTAKDWIVENKVEYESYQLLGEGIVMNPDACRDICADILDSGLRIETNGKEVYLGDDGDFYLRN